MNKITLDLFLDKSKTTFKGLFVMFAFLLMNAQTSWGQTNYVSWDFTPTLISGAYANTQANMDKVRTTSLTGATFTGITLTGVSTVSSTVLHRTTGWPNNTASVTAAADRYVEFTITLGSGQTFPNSELTLNMTIGNSNSTTAPNRVQTIYGYGDSPTLAVIGSALPVTLSQVAQTAISIPAPGNTTSSKLTIRLAAYLTGGSTPSGNFRISTIALTAPASAPAPAITNATFTAATTVLAENTNIYTVTASNSPTSFAATGLPSGLSISNTGVISGTPASGTATSSPYTVGLTATNAGGTSPNVDLTLTINKANQTITFTPTLTNKVVADTPVSLTATASSGLPVSYGTSDSGVASLSGSTLSFVGAGSSTITASQAGNADYNAATSVTQNQVVTAAPLSDQTITFNALSPVTFGDATFDLTATASSSLPVTYSSSNEAVATVSGSTVTIVGVGSTNITASQAGNGSFKPAANVIQVLTVNAKTLKVDVPAFNDNSVKVYKNNGAIYVNSTAKTIKTIEVYDVQGRLIAQQRNVNAATASIQNVKALHQMLIVKVTADDNSVVSKKVLN